LNLLDSGFRILRDCYGFPDVIRFFIADDTLKRRSIGCPNGKNRGLSLIFYLPIGLIQFNVAELPVSPDIKKKVPELKNNSLSTTALAP
jgi:hypothetical protein